MSVEIRFFAQRINFNIQNGLFSRENDLVTAVIGPFTFLYNDEKKEIFATTSENARRFGTLVEEKVPISHLNIMDAFVYFLSQIVFTEAGYKMAQVLSPNLPPILLAREFYETVLKKLNCTEGENIRRTFAELLWVSTIVASSSTEQNLVKLYLKLKTEVDAYHRISSVPPIPESTVYSVPKDGKKNANGDDSEVFVRF